MPAAATSTADSQRTSGSMQHPCTMPQGLPALTAHCCRSATSKSRSASHPVTLIRGDESDAILLLSWLHLRPRRFGGQAFGFQILDEIIQGRDISLEVFGLGGRDGVCGWIVMAVGIRPRHALMEPDRKRVR